MNTTKELLVEMLCYKRPDNSDTNIEFCEVFLEPVFGGPDMYGNYLHTVENYNGTIPDVLFTAHHDTVHYKDGMQDVEVTTGGLVALPDDSTSTCLGADCTTGVWLILGMIEAGIPGTYVIHAAEEVGCVGSSMFVQDNAHWLENYKYCISFDRYGYRSVITHQCGLRTASEAFAHSFADVVGMEMLKPDSGGVFTDSNEYRDIVPECTNISVGYFDQHSSKETQDLIFADMLLSNLINADWSKLVCERDPSDYETNNPYSSRGGAGRYGWLFDNDDTEYDTAYYGESSKGYGEGSDDRDIRDIMDLMDEYPYAIAESLFEVGITADVLIEELARNERYALEMSQYSEGVA